MRRLVLALAACGGSTAIEPDAAGPASGNGPADDPSSSGVQVLRQLTGDGTTIADDWTAAEGGATFAVVKDGSPDKPYLSSAHFAGRSSLAFQVPSDDTGHKQRVEYKLLAAADRKASTSTTRATRRSR